jgi:hypothetical protein
MVQDCPGSVVTSICTWSFRSGKKLKGLNWQAARAGTKPASVSGTAIDADFQNVMLHPVKRQCADNAPSQSNTRAARHYHPRALDPDGRDIH